MKHGPFLLILTILLTVINASFASTYTVDSVSGSVRFSDLEGKPLSVGVHDSFETGVIIRTYRDSAVAFSGGGHHFLVYASSLLRVKSEPSLTYGKLSKSADGRFLDLHFYYIPAPAQGGSVKVVARTGEEDVSMRASLVSEETGVRELVMYETGRGTFRALAGFDCQAPAVRYQLRIRASRGDDVYTMVIFPFFLRETSYSSGTVALSKGKAPLFEDSARKQQEVRHLSTVLASPSSMAMWEGTFGYPLERPEVISAYGRKRTYYMDGKRIRVRHHRGVDYRADYGTPVYAPNHGTVVLARDRVTTGNTLVIDHGHGVFSLFFHLQGFSVAEGMEVHKGDQIAEAGSSGIAAGPHLHWGMFVNGFYVDPEQWIRRRF
jgi:murein DD-endopeptidase MepM/ murein hydrolase activator NlpD